jgi:hypothetical protein
MMKQYPCQLARLFYANCILKLQQNFTVRCRIYIFTTLLKMGLQYSLRILKYGKHNLILFGWRWTSVFPLHWSTLRFGLVVMHPLFVHSNNPVKHTRWFKNDRDLLYCTYNTISPGHILTTLYVLHLHTVRDVARIYPFG